MKKKNEYSGWDYLCGLVGAAIGACASYGLTEAVVPLLGVLIVMGIIGGAMKS